jgi:hypothetical protein
MNIDSTARFLSSLLDLFEDFLSEFRTRMIASQLIQSVAATAAKYRAAQRTRCRARVPSKMCLVLEEADRSNAWLERMERKRLSRRLELVRQVIFVADGIIEKSFSPRVTARRHARYTIVPNVDFQLGVSSGPSPSSK